MGAFEAMVCETFKPLRPWSVARIKLPNYREKGEVTYCLHFNAQGLTPC